MAKTFLFKTKDKEGELDWTIKQDLFWGGISVQLKQTSKIPTSFGDYDMATIFETYIDYNGKIDWSKTKI
jgi:hypothetical protein